MTRYIPLLALLTALGAQNLQAQLFEALDLETIKASVSDISVPAPEQGNYYLDQNSYDPLLRPRPSGGKLHVIGGDINIPGIDGTLDFARKYRQTAYAVSDLQSDVALTVYTKSIPKLLFKILLGMARDGGDTAGGAYSDINPVVPGDESSEAGMPTKEEILALDLTQEEKERLLVQLRNSKLTINGRVNPFRVTEMVKMFLQIMQEESASGITPKMGIPHTWSPEFIAHCKKHHEVIPLTFTKLLTALASGVTARHFKTGREEALIAYVLSRPDSSVTIDELFRASYRLNDGDFYLAVLTELNILSDFWRHPRRDELAVTRKLSPISNFYQGKGDKYGAWYHFQGILLYGYVRGGLRARLVGGIESTGSHFLSGGANEKQEDYVNSTGGKIGAKTAKALDNREYLSFVADRNYCDPEVYLNLHEDFRDRIEFVESAEFKASLSDSGIWLKSLYRDYLDCHVEVIYNDGTGKLNSDYIVKKDHVDFRKGKNSFIGISSIAELLKARAFISGCVAGRDNISKSFGGYQVPAGARPLGDTGVRVDAFPLSLKTGTAD